MAAQTLQFEVDTSAVHAWLAEALPLAERLPQALRGDFERLSLDLLPGLLCGELVRAVGTDGADQIVIAIGLDQRFESFLAALRTGEPNDFVV